MWIKEILSYEYIVVVSKTFVYWTFESGTAIIKSSPLIDSNKNLYFGCDEGRVYSINSSGQLIWMREEFSPIKSTGALFESLWFKVEFILDMITVNYIPN